MYRLTIEKEARTDLRRMIDKGGEDKVCALRIVALLEDLKSSQALLSQLLTQKFSTDDFNVDKFIELYNAGFNVWRIALYRVDFSQKHRGQLPFRVLYGYDEPCTTFRVLGIIPRDFDYDPQHELCQRVLRSYDDLGLPKYRARYAGPSGYRSH